MHDMLHWVGGWARVRVRVKVPLRLTGSRLSVGAAQVMMNETAQQNMENHPVIRTLYDHVDEVTCLAFHPTEQILASGSRDYTLKLFDYSKPSAKRAFKYIQVRRREEHRCRHWQATGTSTHTGIAGVNPSL